MYFDHCENPGELGKAISGVLSHVTFVRAELRGSTRMRLVGPDEVQMLKQAFLEARSRAKNMRKRNPALPPVPDTPCLPLEGLLNMAAWCDQAAAHWLEPKPILNEQGQSDEIPRRAEGAARQRQNDRKRRQLATILRRVAGRIDEWAELQPPFAFCTHPGVEPAGTAEKVGERIQGQIRDAIEYGSERGFDRVVSQLRLQGHQNIADVAERALNNLLDAVKSKVQEAAETLSQRIYYAAIVEQAKLSATQVMDAAAELETVETPGPTASGRKRAGGKAPYPTEGNTGQTDAGKWSRYMPLTQIAERLFKDGKKWRKVKRFYADILEQKGGKGSKDWRIRLDGFDEDTRKLFDRP